MDRTKLSVNLGAAIAGRWTSAAEQSGRRLPAAVRAAATALAVVFCCLLGGPRAGSAGDWPQILGPDRNGKAQGEHLLKAFPAAGPKTVWTYPVGSGFAGVAVVGQRVVLFHRLQDESVAEALDALTGKQLWKKAFPTHYVSRISEDNGPRCVPLVYEGSVFLCGASGDLHCLSLQSGEIRWERNAYAEFHGDEGYFGAGTSPIVDSGRLLMNVGGRPGAGLVAFSLKDGKTLWKATDEAASYSSPSAATIDGVRHVVFVTRLNVVSVDPKTGEERFRFPFGARGPTVNAATPLILGSNLFVSASYNIGAQWAKIGKDKAEIVWQNDDTMSSQFATCVEKDGFLYGVDGRQDGAARLRCIDPRTATVQWTEDGIGISHLILADNRLLILSIDGRLILAEPSPQKFRPLASAAIFDIAGSRNVVQALPALSNGRLFARDATTLKCIDLRPTAEK